MEWFEAFLVAARLMGAVFNIVHDCDEVYNYWEPLHYLVHGTGMQTWEYSSKFALRPYLYVLLHWPVATAAGLVFGDGEHKYLAFYSLRIALSLLSAILDIRLTRAVTRHASSGARLAVLLACCTGSFLAPATLLPSTFAMYCMTSATTGVLNSNVQEVILAAVVGVLLGWPVAGVAFLPYALYVLASPRLLHSFGTLTAVLVVVLALVTATDTYFYGRVTVSLYNFILYNVVGGGESARYGVEPWHFYLVNGLLNFNTAMLLALAYPLVTLLKGSGLLSTPLRPATEIAFAPLFVWLAAISALPHKEERFLYVVYPQIVLGAALTLDSLPRLASDIPSLLLRLSRTARDNLRRLGSLLTTVLLAQIVLVSLSRSMAVLKYYAAPMSIWRGVGRVAGQLHSGSDRPLAVCVGAQWHQFPSSFFLPAGTELVFVDSVFSGLLPKAFSKASGGTRAAPKELNSENKKDARLLLDRVDDCAMVVALDTGNVARQLEGAFVIHSKVAFLENSQAALPYRAFWLPGWDRRNPYSQYGLWSKRSLAASQTV